MKIASKLMQFAGAIGLTVAIVAVSAVPTHAINTAAECTQISTLADKSGAALTAKLAAMDADFSNRHATIVGRTTTIDPKVDAARAKATETFNTKVTNLENQTGLTAVQKAAIQTYSTSMQTAEKTRATAVDAARTTYRSALNDVVTTHQKNLTNAATTYQSAVATAFATAEKSCSAGDSTARTTLRTDIKTAKTAFNTSRVDTKVTADIKALMTTRNTAIATADATFAKDAAALTATLSAVLGTSASTTHP